MALQGQKPLQDLLAGIGEARGRVRSSQVEPTFARRYECKYLIDSRIAPEIREYLSPFVRPDSFAARRPARRYPVDSLYLDSRDLLLYRQTLAGERDRFKLRVRIYSDDPDQPAFFEVKRKVSSVVQKRRAGLSREQASAVLTDRSLEVLSTLSGRRLRDLEYFQLHAARIHARPLIRVRYWREAYEATGNEPVRVTIDTGLEHALTGNLEARTDWTPTPLEGTILEIKFTERFPWWLEEFVRRFDLRQQSVPKYILSVSHVLNRTRDTGLGADGNLPAGSWS